MGKPTDFVGLQNYLRLFTNETAAIAFRNTALYALMVVPAVLLLGTILAVFVNKQLTGVKVFRAVYFSPQVVTMTVVAVVWSYIFSPGQAGLLNSFLGKPGDECTGDEARQAPFGAEIPGENGGGDDEEEKEGGDARGHRS